MRRIKTTMTGNRRINNNPIVEEGISNGNQFLTNNGEMYSPGNYLYDKHNGKYHIHKSGHVCAGTHNSMVLQTFRLLVELPKNTVLKNKLLNSLGINNG